MHSEIWTHPKVSALCRELKIKKVPAVGYLTSLWHFVLINAWRDANLERWQDAGIEEACRWDGKPGKMIKALRDTGFLDDFIVHGWLENAGKLVTDRLKVEEKRRREKAQKGNTPEKVTKSRRQLSTDFDNFRQTLARVE